MRQRSVHPRDLLQLPTAITAGSLGLVCDGSNHIDTTRGKVEVAVGRFGDVVDGYVARKYDMVSDAGAIADAASDKLGMAVIGRALWKHDIAPKPVLLGMAARNLMNAGATLYNGLHDPEKHAIRPPKDGKYAMAADNISLGAFMVADALKERPTAHKIARGIGYTAAVVGTIVGLKATKRYLHGEFDMA